MSKEEKKKKKKKDEDDWCEDEDKTRTVLKEVKE